jgi:hypothetical protein
MCCSSCGPWIWTRCVSWRTIVEGQTPRDVSLVSSWVMKRFLLWAASSSPAFAFSVSFMTRRSMAKEKHKIHQQCIIDTMDLDFPFALAGTMGPAHRATDSSQRSWDARGRYREWSNRLHTYSSMNSSQDKPCIAFLITYIVWLDSSLRSMTPNGKFKTCRSNKSCQCSRSYS